ncbi:phage tail protein [Salmonella enterica subsp. enterica serovar Weltevreden]|uniref:phage tail-collar fiber domain-containing protein n=1 Tax=Salmonella enterica TaxID=28901 RepID=UPI00016C21E5|nr:phage tail protein [Salmonella enterica subsp. enterica serovar Weltevreden]EAP0627133.1 phage tail protein [Salmonella enterica]EBS1155184.1 phage tail protein [Salmonella enterica subsp. enterica serovar Stanley]EBZ1215112.1 phage tail protein [Salmonella enterica subsp. enterica serovar Agona]ECF6991221.1 phage tail protein [Salmonella enterica subsp. enterica]ECN7698839.1 phage tail protein [Salmonella enterica subsp. enterica serovar Heidelberg]EDA8487340.1 phage tail protein [Salmone
MSQTTITLVFEQWKAQQGTTGEPVLLDEFVFANVPALDPDQPVDRNETLPPAEQIVHRQAVSRKGVVNDNAVVHSVVLGADVGDFSFNWIGLINKASGTLAMIVHAPLQQKLKTAEGQQGNVLTRSFLMEYNGAQAETGINTPAETWQIDFTARMAGMDERQRLENIDIFGAAAFFGDGYLVGKSGNQFYVTKGTGYVAGLRTTLAENLNITVTTRPVKVWLDVCWTGTLTSVWGLQSRITVADNLADYVQNGVQHYVFAVAGIDENGNITDLRPKGTLNEQQASDALRKHEQSRNHPDATTREKGFVQLSSDTNSESESLAATPKAVKTAMDNANGRLAKNSNGGDIPDKKQFARTIGAVTSTTITLGESGWFKIATVVMPQATSTAVIKLYGGAGFNAGSPEQAAISELVLRAGNGSPVGITATLWRRSPAAANEVAWVNTSGDTYDIYINIGQYAYWLIAQYDYTGNANVTLYSTPEYSSVQPGNSTSGQTYTIYSSLMKPTAGDVGALPITGGRLNGPLGIGTDNALGGNSIVLGDNDTGFKQDGDGILGIYANNARVGYIDNSGLHMSVDVITNGGIRAGDGKRLSLTSNNNSTMTATFNLWGDANRPTVIELDDDQGWHLYSQRNPDGSIVFTVNGDITANTLRAGGAIYQNNGDIFGSLWGNGWLSTWINNNLVLDVQLGAGTSVTTWNNAGSWPNTPGYVVTSVWKDAQGENIDGINYAPLQKRVGSQWYTVQGGTV